MIRQNVIDEYMGVITRWIIAKRDGGIELYETPFQVILDEMWIKMDDDEKKYLNNNLYNKKIS